MSFTKLSKHSGVTLVLVAVAFTLITGSPALAKEKGLIFGRLNDKVMGDSWQGVGELIVVIGDNEKKKKKFKMCENGYVAGEALRRIRDVGPARLLVGFKMVGRGVARHGYPIKDSDAEIGQVTSGGYSPTLDTNIGLGYVPTGHSAAGSRFLIDIRGRLVEAEVTTLPFYARRKSA